VTTRRFVVVGGGIAGLAAAAAIRRDAPSADVLVLEARDRVGGLVETERTCEGFVVEHGADCLVTAKPWGTDAVHAVGLGDAIVTGTRPRRSYLATRDGLIAMPEIFAGLSPASVLSLLRTPLLTLGGKARMGLESFVPRRRSAGDESVLAFVTRRFGRELADALVSPLIGGVYGGDASRLSAEACLPRLREFEHEHGSVTRGLQRAIRARRRHARAGRTVLPATVSLRDGMSSLPEALARALGERVKLGVAVEGVTPLSAGRFRIDTPRGAITCDGVIVAAPAWQAPSLLERASKDLAAGLGDVAHTALDCVTLAWSREEVPHALDGTGWVRARDDGRRTTACTWSSRKWPGRAPDGLVLMRSVLTLPDADEHELIAAACGDLRDLVGVAAPPRLTRIRRLARATPIYEIGHHERMARLAAQAADLGALALAGNAHGGVGLPDCIASGERAARAVLAAVWRSEHGGATRPPLSRLH
jgi:oxygen-dependent protoporphyrinogen oxidase